MKIIRMITCFLILSLLVPTISFSESKPQIILNGKTIALNQEVIIKSSRTYIPLRTLSENMGYLIKYNNISKTVILIRPDLTVQMPLLSSQVIVNGKTVNNSELLVVQKGITYIPLRFLIENMGAAINWNASTNIISISDKNFAVESNNNETYWVSFGTGEVYYMENNTIQQLKDANISPITEGKIKLTHFDNHKTLLTVADEHGANLTNFINRYQLFIQDHAVVKKTYFTYMGMYNTGNFPSQPYNQLFLSDGNTLQLIDASGNLSKEYPLADLTGTDGPFIIEYATPEIVLVRPIGNLQLIYITLANGNATMLNKKLMTEKESAYMDDLGVPADSFALSFVLKFDRQVGDTLFFHYTSPITEQVKNVGYKLSEQN